MPEKETLEELVHREASEIVDNHHIKTFEDTAEIYCFDKESGLYIPAEKKFITAIEFKLGEKATRRVIEEILAKIRRMTYVKRESIEEPNLVPVRNGIFQIEEQTIIPYSHKYFSRQNTQSDFHCWKLIVGFVQRKFPSSSTASCKATSTKLKHSKK